MLIGAAPQEEAAAIVHDLNRSFGPIQVNTQVAADRDSLVSLLDALCFGLDRDPKTLTEEEIEAARQSARDSLAGLYIYALPDAPYAEVKRLLNKALLEIAKRQGLDNAGLDNAAVELLRAACD